MKISRSLASVFMLVLVLQPQRLLAEWDDYDDSQSNPLRIAAYLLYPVGFWRNGHCFGLFTFSSVQPSHRKPFLAIDRTRRF